MPDELGQRSLFEAGDDGDIFLLAARKRRSVIEVTLCCWKHTGSILEAYWKHTGSSPCGHTHHGQWPARGCFSATERRGPLAAEGVYIAWSEFDRRCQCL